MKDFLSKLNWVSVLSIAVAIATQLGNGSMSLAHQLPAAWLPGVQEAAGNLGSIGALIVSAGAYGRVPGSSIPSVPTIVKVLILAFLLSMFLGSAPTMAQVKLRPPAVTGKPIEDIKTDLGIPTAKLAAAPATAATANTLAGVNFNTIGQKLQAVAKDVIDKGIADLTAASTDAQNHNDLIAKPCWDAQVTFLKQLPSEWQTPPTDIGPALAIQISRDLLNSVTGNDQTSLKVACAALIGDQISIINQTLAIVGIAGIAGLPAGL